MHFYNILTIYGL